MILYYFNLRHSSPRASIKCRFGPLSADFDLLIVFFSFVSAGLAAYVPVLGS